MSAPPKRPVLDVYLDLLLERHATDLHLTAGAPPLMRLDGDLQHLDDDTPLRPADVERVVVEMLSEESLAKLHELKTLDFSFNWQDRARFRVNAFFQRGSMALALRVIPYRIPTFDELGLPPACQDLVRRHQGLVLVTGPTGSGKSSTLASMIAWINRERPVHVLTIEDPIEYVHRHGRAIVNQRELGEDVTTFAEALRASLREDPDVLLVGEMRDLETIQTALTIAETGHLVFATLHTNDTAQAIDRIVDVFPHGRQRQIQVQLANALEAVIYQRLVPRVGGGRVAAFEVLLATNPVRNLILEGKTRQLRNVITGGIKGGMQTFEMSLNQLLAAGLITYEDAAMRSLYPRELVPAAS